MEEDGPAGAIVIGIGGIGGKVASMVSGPCLILDTDARTKDMFPGKEVLVLGETILGGEGSGRNLKLGMIAFRSAMEELAKKILPRMPVIIVAGSEGGTGISGAVELNSFLSRANVPRFNIILAFEGPTQDPGREAMAMALLSGILHPGAVVRSPDLGMAAKAMDLFSRASVPGPGLRITLEAWNWLQRGRGPFDIEVRSIPPQELSLVAEGKGPSIRGISLTAIEAPGSVPALVLKKAVEYYLGHGLSISVGVTQGSSEDVFIATISEPVNPGPIPVPGNVPELNDLFGGDLMDQNLSEQERLH